MFKILDFKNENLDSSGNLGSNIQGLYETIESCSKNNVFLLTGLTIDNIERNAVYAQCYVLSGKFNFFAYDCQITIESDNTVMAVSMFGTEGKQQGTYTLKRVITQDSELIKYVKEV